MESNYPLCRALPPAPESIQGAAPVFEPPAKRPPERQVLRPLWALHATASEAWPGLRNGGHIPADTKRQWDDLKTCAGCPCSQAFRGISGCSCSKRLAATVRSRLEVCWTSSELRTGQSLTDVRRLAYAQQGLVAMVPFSDCVFRTYSRQ